MHRFFFVQDIYALQQMVINVRLRYKDRSLNGVQGNMKLVFIVAVI